MLVEDYRFSYLAILMNRKLSFYFDKVMDVSTCSLTLYINATSSTFFLYFSNTEVFRSQSEEFFLKFLQVWWIFKLISLKFKGFLTWFLLKFFCKKTSHTCFVKCSQIPTLIYDKMFKYCSVLQRIHNTGIILFSYIYELIYERFWLSLKFTDALTSQHGWKTSG